ncbi:MAG: ATP-binding protein [Halobacteria archaeon]
MELGKKEIRYYLPGTVLVMGILFVVFQLVFYPSTDSNIPVGALIGEIIFLAIVGIGAFYLPYILKVEERSDEVISKTYIPLYIGLALIFFRAITDIVDEFVKLDLISFLILEDAPIILGSILVVLAFRNWVITEREKTFELEETKNRLNLALEVTDTGVWRWNTETDEVSFSESMRDMYGIGTDGNNDVFEVFREMIHPDDVDEVIDSIEAALQDHGSFEEMFRIQHEEGGELWVESKGEVYEQDGERWMAGIITDISEMKKKEQELRKSNERLEQFAYVAAHNLREPLRTISRYVGAIQEDHGENLNEEGKSFLDVVVTASERMKSMIDGLMDYSEVTTRGKGGFEEIDVEEVMDAVETQLDVMIRDRGADIQRDELPTLVADPEQIHQVFYNLVHNSLEHTGDGPVTVEVKCKEVIDSYIFQICDDGPGIKEERQDKIFRMFKTDEGYQTTSDAKGIGLALTENIVSRHEGDIWVESEVGEGTCFKFRLPKDNLE